MAKLLGLLLLFSASTIFAAQTDETNVKTYKVGVLANHGVESAKKRWTPMMMYLSQHVPNAQFEVVPLSFDEMDQQLLNEEIQFIITNPGQYLNLSNQLPLSWLATMRSDRHQGATYAISSAIIVPASSSIQNINDLEGVTVVASAPQALGGYQAVMGLLKKRNYVANEFFGEVKFLGFPLEPLIYQVRDHVVDAAITPFCTLENMVDAGLVEREDFRVINGVVPANYECETSTELYPNWSFAGTASVPNIITQALTEALFDLPPDSEVAKTARTQGWTAPISQLKVIKLFKDLNIENDIRPFYKVALSWAFKNKEWGLSLLLLFVISTVYHLWLEYKFRQKSDFLLATERQLRDKELQLVRMQSAAVLGELGAGLAHELNQPIAAITQYSEGGSMMLDSLDLNNQQLASLKDICEKIHSQSIRAGSVVHRIRGLLYHQRTEPQQVNIEPILNDAIELLQRTMKQAQVDYAFNVIGQPRKLLADEVGLSQMFVNVLKNAFDAIISNNKKRQLRVTLIYDTSRAEQGLGILIKISDTGGGLTAPAAELMASFNTTKEGGLGLGLAICSDVVKQHSGTIEMNNNGLGCDVEIWLPYGDM